MARLSLPLLFLTLLASTTSPANEISPRPLDHWQESDWKGVPDSTRIDKQRVLFAKHDGDSYLGLAILLPDWQRSGQLWQLTGIWVDSASIPCCCSSPADRADPASEKKQENIDAFRRQFAERIVKLGDAKLQEGGFKLLLAQGTSAAWAANLITSEQLPAPDALVLLDGFFPNQLSNQTLAKQVAQASIPTLDLYQEDGDAGPYWLPRLARARAAAATSSTTVPMP